jgi:SAM-dependent methyltransferase
VHFFEKQVTQNLERRYADYSRSQFLEDQKLKDLWEMDERNKATGVTRKLWWEDHIGKVENKRVLEVGCGVNYLVPYWLESGNELLAFDVCKESVQLTQELCKKFGVPVGKGTFACADATTVRFSRKFDIISANNVLHHVENRVASFKRMGESLVEGGMLLLVEPNYYYPPRWIIETDMFDPFNPVKNYFMRNEILEKGEKAIIFSTFKKELWEAGFEITVNEKDQTTQVIFPSTG